MERHKLWNDRAEKLMEKTFEKFGYGKKKEPAKEEKKEEIKENLQEAPRYGEDYADMDGEDDGGNSLLDMDDYNMLVQAVEEPVRKLIAGGHTKEDLLDAFKVMLGFENVNEAPRYGEDYADMDGDEDEETSDGMSDVQRLALRIEVLKKRIQNQDGITGEDVVEELELISSMLQSSAGMNEDETENPEVDRAEDAARKAKIKALQVQLKALQKTQSME